MMWIEAEHVKTKVGQIHQFALGAAVELYKT